MKSFEFVGMNLEEIPLRLRSQVCDLVESVRYQEEIFSAVAIQQATRDQERYDTGWNAGVEFAESKQQPLAEAYALVIRDLEPEREDAAVVDVLLALHERLARLTSGRSRTPESDPEP